MTKSTLSIQSPAKINLFLEITEKRSDGFHNLESVFQTIPLYDTLSVEAAEELSLEVDNPNIPTDINNLVLQAAEQLRKESGVTDGGHFKLHKKIPNTGGLGGGSSNAASTLILLNKLWGLNLTKNELAKIGSKIGSDVAFFIYGGVCHCQGRGELVTPLPEIAPLPVNIFAPEWGISTPMAFSHLNPKRFNMIKVSNFIDTIINNINDLYKIYNESFNHFEETVFKIEPRQRSLQETLISNGLLARMSGSGSCIWAFNPDKVATDSISLKDCRVLI